MKTPNFDRNELLGLDFEESYDWHVELTPNYSNSVCTLEDLARLKRDELFDLGFTDELKFHVEVVVDTNSNINFSNVAAYAVVVAIDKTDWPDGLVPDFDKTPIKQLASTYVFELKADIRVESQVLKLIRKPLKSPVFISNINQN